MEIFKAKNTKCAEDVDFDSLNTLNDLVGAVGVESHTVLWIIDYKDVHGEYKHRYIKSMVSGNPKFEEIMPKMEEMLEEPFSSLGVVMAWVDISEDDCRKCMDQDYIKAHPAEATELMKKGICLFVDTTY